MVDKILHNGIHGQDIVSKEATYSRIRDACTSAI